MSIDSLIAISNALSVSTDAILFGEITYDKELYYKGKRSIGGTLVDLPIFLDN